jgi:hypothetical protein
MKSAKHEVQLTEFNNPREYESLVNTKDWLATPFSSLFSTCSYSALHNLECSCRYSDTDTTKALTGRQVERGGVEEGVIWMWHCCSSIPIFWDGCQWNCCNLGRLIESLLSLKWLLSHVVVARSWRIPAHLALPTIYLFFVVKNVSRCCIWNGLH